MGIFFLSDDTLPASAVHMGNSLSGSDINGSDRDLPRRAGSGQFYANTPPPGR
jgi:hypothetical protein